MDKCVDAIVKCLVKVIYVNHQLGNVLQNWIPSELDDDLLKVNIFN